MSQSNLAEAEQCAGYLKAIADPTRYRIVKALCGSPFTVSDIAEGLGVEIALVSHHLRVLYHADIVTTERDGRFIYYSLNPNLAQNRRRPEELNFGCCRLDLEQ